MKLGYYDFAEALARGMGRAKAHVLEHGDAGVEDLLEAAVVHESAWDPQVEAGGRARWLASFLPWDRGRYRAALMEALREPEPFWWDHNHRVALARRLGLHESPPETDLQEVVLPETPAPPARLSVEELLAAAKADQPGLRGRLVQLGRKATPEEAKQVYTAMVSASPGEFETLLRFFRECRLPELGSFVLEAAHNGHEGLRQAAFHALKHHRDAKVREAALAELDREECVGAAIEALVAQGVEGDRAIIQSRLEKAIPPPRQWSGAGIRKDGFWSREDESSRRLHEFGNAMLEALADHHPGAPEASLHEWLYVYTPFGVCRKRAVDWLQKHRLASQQLQSEWKLDAACE